MAVRPSGTLTSWNELSSFIPTLSRNHNLENRNNIPDSESLAQNHKYPHSSSGYEIPLFINGDHIIMQSTLATQGVITKISFQALPSHLGSFELNMSEWGTQFHFNLLKQLLMFKHAMHCHSPQKPTMHQI